MIVIGNPYELSSSVSVGVVSALGRNLKINKIYANLIQTDAAINPGNSGRALLDAEGNTLGIVTAICGEGKVLDLRFLLMMYLLCLIIFFRVMQERPIIGFFIEKRRDEKGPYLYDSKVLPQSPAEEYGVKIGDRILRAE